MERITREGVSTSFDAGTAAERSTMGKPAFTPRRRRRGGAAILSMRQNRPHAEGACSTTTHF
eukprot:scaffold27894_cov135-Isochrysis_galbana.AAC.1